MVTLTLIRGLPGSGKSKVGAALSSATNAPLIEPDDFHRRGDEYVFSHDNTPYAHQQARGRAAKLLFDGHSVIVADVFPRLSDVALYQAIATHFHADFQVIEVIGPWRDRHNVRAEDRAEMIAAWEHYPVPNGGDHV